MYSWFVYRFIPVAEFHAIASVEYALRLKIGKRKWGLKKLLSYAVENKLIADDDFEIFRESKEKRKAHGKVVREVFGISSDEHYNNIEGGYTSALMVALPNLRNNYAHGSSTVAPEGFLTLKICAEIINKIFSKIVDFQ